MQLHIISIAILFCIVFINAATLNGQDLVNSIGEQSLLDTKSSGDSKPTEDVVVMEVPVMDSQDLEAMARIGVGTVLSITSGAIKGTEWLIKKIKG